MRFFSVKQESSETFKKLLWREPTQTTTLMAGDYRSSLRGLEFGDYHSSSTDNLPKRQI